MSNETVCAEPNREKVVHLFGPNDKPPPAWPQEDAVVTQVEVKPEIGVFVDPGSRETGWCVATPEPEFGVNILGAGTLGFDLRHDKLPYMRIDDIAHGLDRLMNAIDPSPSIYVVEVTSGKVNRTRHRGGGAGLGIFGAAVGALWMFGKMWRPAAGGRGPVVIPVTENLWKSGFGKLKSVRVARRHFKKYDEKNDPEFNIADAIALAVWYYTALLRKTEYLKGGCDK